MKPLSWLLLAMASASAGVAQEKPAGATSRVGLKASIDAGHVWLKKHQEKDGHFSASMFLVHDPRGKACDGSGKPDQDVFVTSLVSRAWCGMGWLPDGARKHEFQCRAMDWLQSQVQEDGSLNLPGSRTGVRDTAIGVEVLYWANRYEGDRADELDFKLTGQWLAAQRLPQGFWSARAKAVGSSNDAKRPADWLTTQMTAQFLSVTEQPITWESLKGFVDVQADEMPGAAAGGGAYLAAWYLRDTDRRTKFCNLALAKLPAKHTRADLVDYYSWYGTTQAMQFEAKDNWKTWWQALATAAVSMQRTDSSYAGSWDPVDVRGREGGRIYATATMLLALEVVWRKQYRGK